MKKLIIAIFLLLNIAISSSAAAEKVLIQFYYQAVCRGCSIYLRRSLKKALYTEGLDRIFDLKLYPYGNATQKQLPSGEWEFTCQFGETECYGNINQTCIIGLYPANIANKAVICTEEQYKITKDFDAALQVCSVSFQLDVEKIQECARGKLGNELEHQMGVDTESLIPDHTYVPWVVIDGVFNEEAENELEDYPVEFICQKYQGSDKPAVCDQYLEKSQNKPSRSSKKEGYCYKNEVVKSFLK